MPKDTNSTKNIAVVIGQLAQGGSERQLYGFLKHCDRQCWTPTVFVSQGPMGFWDEPIRKLGIQVILLEGNPLQRMRIFRWTCMTHQVKRFFSWSSHTNAYGLALVGMGVLNVGSFRNDFKYDFPERHRSIREWASLAGISIAVCNSQETAAAVRNRVARNKHVIYMPNGVSLVKDADFHRKKWRQKLDIGADECLVLGVGRLSAQKNFIRFVEVIAAVNRDVSIRAVVAGRNDGCLQRLQQRAMDLDLQPDELRFLGAVAEARELMCAADIFLLTSDYEGMPNVVLEAMAAGVPCVCTRVNGVSDLIQTGINGFVTDHQTTALAEKLSLLAEDISLRREMGKKAKLRVGTEFDPKTIAERFWDLMD